MQLPEPSRKPAAQTKAPPRPMFRPKLQPKQRSKTPPPVAADQQDREAHSAAEPGQSAREQHTSSSSHLQGGEQAQPSKRAKTEQRPRVQEHGQAGGSPEPRDEDREDALAGLLGAYQSDSE
jgi:hypothetical protein